MRFMAANPTIGSTTVGRKFGVSDVSIRKWRKLLARTTVPSLSPAMPPSLRARARKAITNGLDFLADPANLKGCKPHEVSALVKDLAELRNVWGEVEEQKPGGDEEYDGVNLNTILFHARTGT